MSQYVIFTSRDYLDVGNDRVIGRINPGDPIGSLSDTANKRVICFQFLINGVFQVFRGPLLPDDNSLSILRRVCKNEMRLITELKSPEDQRLFTIKTPFGRTVCIKFIMKDGRSVYSIDKIKL